MGVTDFILKIIYMISESVHLFREKVLIIRYDLSSCWCKNFMNESLETSLHRCSLCQHLKSLKVKLTFSNSKLSELQNEWNLIAWTREMGKNKLPTSIFCSFFDNQQKFLKEGEATLSTVSLLHCGVLTRNVSTLYCIQQVGKGSLHNLTVIIPLQLFTHIKFMDMYC